VTSASLTGSQGRIWIRNQFCTGFFPQGLEAAGAPFFTSPGVDDEPSLSASNALCLLLLGIRYESVNALQTAFKLYQIALVRLRYAIENVKTAAPLDQIATSVVCMALFEVCASSGKDIPAWLHHAEGLITIYRVCEQGTHPRLTWAVPFTLFLFTFATNYALIKRKAIRWEAPAFYKDLIRRRMPILDLCAAVPACLESLDSVLANKFVDRVAVANAVDSALSLRANINRAVREWEADLTTKAKVPYAMIDVHHYPDFIAIMTSVWTLYPKAVSFANFDVARTCRFYWRCSLLLDQAVLDVYSEHASMLQTMKEVEVPELQLEVRTNVDNLLQSIPWWVVFVRYMVLLRSDIRAKVLPASQPSAGQCERPRNTLLRKETRHANAHDRTSAMDRHRIGTHGTRTPGSSIVAGCVKDLTCGLSYSRQ
jgi:hypothetical protein